MKQSFEGYIDTPQYLPLRTKTDIFETLGQLSMPTDSYFVLGGGNLVLRDIRHYTTDLDVLVNDEMFELLQLVEGAEVKLPPKPAISRGATNTTVWVRNRNTPIPLSATTSLGDGYFPMSFESHKESVELIDGIPCIPLDDVINAKTALQRPKDIRDLDLIGRHIGVTIVLPAQVVVDPQFLS